MCLLATWRWFGCLSVYWQPYSKTFCQFWFNVHDKSEMIQGAMVRDLPLDPGFSFLIWWGDGRSWGVCAHYVLLVVCNGSQFVERRSFWNIESEFSLGCICIVSLLMAFVVCYDDDGLGAAMSISVVNEKCIIVMETFTTLTIFDELQSNGRWFSIIYIYISGRDLNENGGILCIFNSKDMKSQLPLQATKFKIDVSYKYGPTIGQSIFNYNKVLSTLPQGWRYACLWL